MTQLKIEFIEKREFLKRNGSNLVDDVFTIQWFDSLIRKEEIKEWAERYIKEDMKIYGTDKHGITLKDLIDFLEK